MDRAIATAAELPFEELTQELADAIANTSSQP